jgi:hypothetical protein
MILTWKEERRPPAIIPFPKNKIPIGVVCHGTAATVMIHDEITITEVM